MEGPARPGRDRKANEKTDRGYLPYADPVDPAGQGEGWQLYRRGDPGHRPAAATHRPVGSFPDDVEAAARGCQPLTGDEMLPRRPLPGTLPPRSLPQKEPSRCTWPITGNCTSPAGPSWARAVP